MVLEAHNIHKSFGRLEILKGVDLAVRKGEIVAIVGASGAGKSTLLHIVGTLDRPDAGMVSINGTDCTKLGEKRLSLFRNRHIGFVFQFHAGKSVKEAERAGMELLDRLGVGHRARHKPAQLSGGEQQRVSVARALANHPSLILADEPSGNLDSENAASLHQLFFDLRTSLGQTFIIVTHNEELASISDRTIHMRDGLVL